MRDWRDEEQDRRIDEIHHRQTGGGIDDIFEVLVWIVIVAVVIFFVAGLLDNWLGWGLVDWIWGAIYDWSNGFFGKPNN